MYGVSFQKLSALQGPLSSLNVAAHVIYRIARVRFVGNNLSFSLTASENVRYRALLMDELKLLRQEYSALLYGGEVITYVSTRACECLFACNMQPTNQSCNLLQ